MEEPIVLFHWIGTEHFSLKLTNQLQSSRIWICLTVQTVSRLARQGFVVSFFADFTTTHALQEERSTGLPL